MAHQRIVKLLNFSENLAFVVFVTFIVVGVFAESFRRKFCLFKDFGFILFSGMFLYLAKFSFVVNVKMLIIFSVIGNKAFKI